MSDPSSPDHPRKPAPPPARGGVVLHPLPWWRRARHLARVGLLVLAAHAVVLVAFEALRPLSTLTLLASVVAILALPRPELRIGWRGGRIQVQAGRHRWSTPATAIDLDAARRVELPAPGPGAPEPGRGEFKAGTWLGPGRWPAQDRAVFCAARPGPALIIPVSPTQALVLSGQHGPEALLAELHGVLAQGAAPPDGVSPTGP